MGYSIKNNSSKDLSVIEKLIEKFYPYAQQKMGFDRTAAIVFESDIKNAENPLGKTAYYEPSSDTVTIYVDERHPKDIMRSLSHELVHHTQNCNGHFNNSGPTEEGYAQKDPQLRKMEEDAYRRGNLIFRDWENQYNLKENKNMKLSQTQLREAIAAALSKLLTESKNPAKLVEKIKAALYKGKAVDEVADESIEELVSPELAGTVAHDPEIVARATHDLDAHESGEIRLPDSVVQVLLAVVQGAATGEEDRLTQRDLAEDGEIEEVVILVS